MAATGGGKIRSRRYHIASKPYAKSKQQSGLISRVTDTVKSIVPSWLQKYFKNGDATEGGGAVQGTHQNCQPAPPPPPPPPPPNGSEEGPPPFDGHDSPEPSTSTTEPSTSRASLNFQEYVLSRPPLSRSHLHFPMLDASSPTLGASTSLFSQPSTSSAPGPFSTGFSLVKEIKDNLSQHEDDNISTTSGFSSRASDKDVPTSKTASLPQLWSPETERTNSGPQPSQSSLKRPAFNLSVFGTSSNSTLNSTVLNSSQLGDSPFYPGKTTYGGAAAVRSARTRPGTPYQAPVRRQIKAKPAGAQSCGVTSATARRILQSLERMSSPLADAKRIPAAAASSPRSPVSVFDKHFYRISICLQCHKMDSPLPPVQKLVVPATASVSGNRSVSFRPTLTPGGVSRTLDRTPSETPTRQLQQLPKATPGPSQSGPAYPLSSTPAASSVSSGGGKMKRERTIARPSSKHVEQDEVADIPDLPAVSLPINTSDLPTFSFSSLPPLTTSATEPQASTPPCVPFTFSSPIVKATAASPPSFSPSAEYTFSAPVAKLGPSMSNGKLASPIKSTEDFEGPFKPAKVLKQGSVLDLLKAPGFASPVTRTSPSPDTASQLTSMQSTAPISTTTSSLSSSVGFVDLFKAPSGWRCDVCLMQNKPSDSKCVCTAPRPNSSSSKSTDTTTSFGTMFSRPAGTWDCDTCLVLNKPDAVKCVACETAKPGTGLKPSITLPSSFSAGKTAPTSTAPASTGLIGFGDKFKNPEGAWDCEVCLVVNKAEDTKCVACMSAKPGNENMCCVNAVHSLKDILLGNSTFSSPPTDSAAAPKPAFSFNATNSTTSSSTTPSLFGTNNSSSSTQASAPSVAPTFVFGQPTAASNDTAPAKAFVFDQSQDSQQPAPSAAPLNSTPAPAPAQPFIFGAPANAAAAAAAPPPAAPSFGFGAAAPSAASSSAPSADSSPFAFSSAPSGGFGANLTPSFGSSFGSPFTASASQTPAFGAKPNTAPSFGQQAGSTPVFGAAANSTPGGGFQFGGASAFGASNNSSGVFTFGAGAAASPAPAANPSIAPQSGAPGGGFNFTQTPTFNIGSAKSFASSPGGQQLIAGRKIKTAVRRRK
uniref:Nuclear pore complex protein Nup153 n=1 Tax=Mastacembelus armatus TaxID=205130 RepID=A0A7N8YGR0_9TELE